MASVLQWGDVFVLLKLSKLQTTFHTERAALNLAILDLMAALSPKNRHNLCCKVVNNQCIFYVLGTRTNQRMPHQYCHSEIVLDYVKLTEFNILVFFRRAICKFHKNRCFQTNAYTVFCSFKVQQSLSPTKSFIFRNKKCKV